MLRLDHVAYAVRDLDETAVRFREEHGLDSVAGGRHVGFGTANRIVPLGDQYIELVGVVDRAEAEVSPFGRSVLERTAERDGWLLIAPPATTWRPWLPGSASRWTQGSARARTGARSGGGWPA